jgi:hypothetical protein
MVELLEPGSAVVDEGELGVAWEGGVLLYYLAWYSKVYPVTVHAGDVCQFRDKSLDPFLLL